MQLLNKQAKLPLAVQPKVEEKVVPLVLPPVRPLLIQACSLLQKVLMAVVLASR